MLPQDHNQLRRRGFQNNNLNNPNPHNPINNPNNPNILPGNPNAVNRFLHLIRGWAQPAKHQQSTGQSLYHYLSKREYIWRLTFFATICFGIFLLEKIYQFHYYPEYDSIDKTDLIDFFGSFLIVAVILGIRVLLKLFIYPHLHQFLQPKLLSNAAENQQIICERLVQILFYVIMSLWGYFIILDVEHQWSITSYAQLFSEQRYTQQLFPESSLMLRAYYIVQIGYHIFFFFEAFIWKLQNRKYYEWLLHHGIAIILLFYSYTFSLLVVGLYVLFWHNVSDLGLVIARTYTLLKWKKQPVTIALYLMEYVLWVYARNYVFPFEIVYNAIAQYSVVSQHVLLAWPIAYLIVLMIALAAMHFYWTYFITQALLYMILGGKEYNSYDTQQNQ